MSNSNGLRLLGTIITIIMLIVVIHTLEKAQKDVRRFQQTSTTYSAPGGQPAPPADCYACGP